jgi:hypothetical protein
MATRPAAAAAAAAIAAHGGHVPSRSLAITFCRSLNIPARYVFGYIPEIDCPPLGEPMDFAAWFEAHIGGRWHTFDARNNIPRTGRVVVGRGRDAVDVALITSFGALTLTGFEVRAGEIAPHRARTDPPSVRRCRISGSDQRAQGSNACARPAAAGTRAQTARRTLKQRVTSQ